MPDTDDELLAKVTDALGGVYPGAGSDEAAALLDKLEDEGLTVRHRPAAPEDVARLLAAALTGHLCPPCPHIQTSDEGTSYCDLAEQTHANCVSRANYEAGEDRIDILREALDELLVLHDSPRARVLAALNRSRA